MKKSFLTVLASLFAIWGAVAQVEFHTGLETRVLDGSGRDLPFWMQHNQRGRIHAETNFMSLVAGKAIHRWGRASELEIGAGILFEDAQEQLQVDELYIAYRNSWLEVIAGRKQEAERFRGLSSTNENILQSLNARPMPGLQWHTARPLWVLPKYGLGFEAGWEDYFLEENRFVRNARLHHKYLRMVFEPHPDFQLKAGIQHYVMWAGISQRLGHQPATLKDYIRVLIGHSGGEGASSGDKQNALGNNLGSYEVILNTRWNDHRITLLWNSIFEDGSGQRLGNTPDGRYGIFIEDTRQRYWVRALMYEFYHTKHQSHTTTGPHKYDNYFNNGVYASGWTYLGKTIGLPFFTPRDEGYGVGNNVFLAHHLGIGGVAFDRVPFKLLTTYRHNYGTSNVNFDSFTFDPAQEIFSGMLEVGLPLSTFDLSLQLGSDFSSHAKPVWGIGFGLRYSLTGFIDSL